MNWVKFSDLDAAFLSAEQLAMAKHYAVHGYEFCTKGSEYIYLECLKEGVRNGYKVLNRTGHDVYVSAGAL